jgi:uncharacterized membrane protein YkvA (DUF1232 family)
VSPLKLIAGVWRAIPKVIPHFRDVRVPFALKAGTVVAGLLIVSPLDLLSDIPVIGLLDDAALLAVLVNIFVMLADRSVMRNVTPRARPAEARKVGPTALKP